MAGAGFKSFTVGEVLTSGDVNTYLMQQSVMVFANSGARGSALGTAVSEGMLSYLSGSDVVEYYDGSGWNNLSGAFTASTAITATNASWPVPTLAEPVVRVTVIGGGGGGGGANATSTGGHGGTGSTSTFACSAGTVTASGGIGGNNAVGVLTGEAGTNYLASGNGGEGGQDSQNSRANTGAGGDGRGGAVTISYLDMTGIGTATVTIGAGGTAGTGTGAGGAGGGGAVIFEYRAG